MFTSPGATVLAGLEGLAALPLERDSLLLALGARELAAALRYSRAREHAVRLLPSATALGQALQLGLSAERIACLRPQTSSSIEGSVEAGLCRRWGITAVLARQSGRTSGAAMASDLPSHGPQAAAAGQARKPRSPWLGAGSAARQAGMAVMRSAL